MYDWKTRPLGPGAASTPSHRPPPSRLVCHLSLLLNKPSPLLQKPRLRLPIPSIPRQSFFPPPRPPASQATAQDVSLEVRPVECWRIYTRQCNGPLAQPWERKRVDERVMWNPQLRRGWIQIRRYPLKCNESRRRHSRGAIPWRLGISRHELFDR